MEMKSCDRCGKEITPITYERTGGLCRPCKTGADCARCGKFVMYPSEHEGERYCSECAAELYRAQLAARKERKKREAGPGPPSESLEESWRRIGAWHDKETPAGTLSLGEGATPAEVAALEAKLGLELPEDLRRSLLLHDGAGGGWLLHFGELLAVRQIDEHWSRYAAWQEKEGFGLGEDYATDETAGLRPVFWDPTRIPLTDNSGDFVFCDLDPGDGGRRGQIVQHSHETGPEEVLAGSWSEWLAKLVADLEGGLCEYDEDEDTVAPIGHY